MRLDEYERNGILIYSRLAEAVAGILDAALKGHPEIRLQQCQHRAKGVTSLREKLSRDDKEGTSTVEFEVKDLGGCRLIFYTNSDVSRFISSGILSECFEFDRERTKYHQPDTRDDGEENLFTSLNFVVRLKKDRAALYEYSEFAGLWCEVQVQTTLNHAWSEMEHDIIYKPLGLSGFGSDAMKGIERRMRSIMRQYLIPAGQEFVMVDYDFQRLSQGLELFDRGPFDELAGATDNNVRFNVLEKFNNYVLPNYDDHVGVYPEVVAALTSALCAARAAPVQPIQTELGVYPGHEAVEIEEQVAESIELLCYIDVERTFDTVCDLFLSARSNEARKIWENLVEKLAKHEREVWKAAGPAVQDLLVKQVRGWQPERRNTLRPILIPMLHAILCSEITGTSTTQDLVTLSTANVKASDLLKEIRFQAIELLEDFFLSASGATEQRAVTEALAEAMRHPFKGDDSDDLLIMIFEDTVRISSFYTKVALSVSLQLRRSIEHELFWLYRRAEQKPDGASEPLSLAADQVNEAIERFRDTVNVDPEFAYYKLLVGTDSVLSVDWERGEAEVDENYRDRAVAGLADDVTEENSELWFKRIGIFAATESKETATFPALSKFLKKLAANKPGIGLDYLSRINEFPEQFVPDLLDGVAESIRADDGMALSTQWIFEKKHIGGIMRHFRSVRPPTAQILKDAFDAAIAADHHVAITDAVSAAAAYHASGTDEFIDDILLPAVEFLTEKRIFDWTRELYYALRDPQVLDDLDEAQIVVLLTCLAQIPRVGHREQSLLGRLTAAEPNRLLDFFEMRLGHEAGTDEGFEVVSPQFGRSTDFSVPVDAAVARAFEWYLADRQLFSFRGGRIIVNLFPTCSDDFKRALLDAIEGERPERFEFVVQILRGYNGQAFLQPICKALITKLPPNDELLSEVEVVLLTSGGVRGKFGFADALKGKKEWLSEWLADNDGKVSSFARSMIGDLDRKIADELRRAGD